MRKIQSRKSSYVPLLPTLLNDQLVQTQLLCCMLEHMLLNTILSDEAEDVYLLRLFDPMSPIHPLQIGLGNRDP
jgi:hypothetical protein